MTARMSDGYEAFVRARTRSQREAIRRVTATEMDHCFNIVVADVNRLTGYMADQTTPKLTNEGTGFTVGWYAEDFIGQENPVTGQIITSFYPVFVIKGTSRMAGNDVLTAALRERRPAILAGYRLALTRPEAVP
jgi:hypothetical protein